MTHFFIWCGNLCADAGTFFARRAMGSKALAAYNDIINSKFPELEKIDEALRILFEASRRVGHDNLPSMMIERCYRQLARIRENTIQNN